MDNKVVTVKTKLDKNDKNPRTTVVTYDFAGCTVETLAGPAIDTLTINLQGRWRRAKAIPQKETVLVKDMVAGMGSRSAPLTPDAIVAHSTTMKPEQVQALIAQLAAGLKKSQAETKGKSKRQDGDQPGATA